MEILTSLVTVGDMGMRRITARPQAFMLPAMEQVITRVMHPQIMDTAQTTDTPQITDTAQTMDIQAVLIAVAIHVPVHHVESADVHPGTVGLVTAA